MRNLLVVEDDDTMAIALCEGFRQEGYEVALATDGEAALSMARQGSPSLIILDVMLPKLSGHDVCKKLRNEGSSVPIIMLTARSQDIDKVLGLKLGADDYITKPFSFMELLARVEAVLRRAGDAPDGQTSSSPPPPAGVHEIGDVTINLETGECRRQGELLELSGRELRLLSYLIAHRDQVIAREVLLDAVWDYSEAPLTRTVDVHVSKLRKKLERDSQHPKYLVTVHGVGYKLRSSPA